MPGAGQCGRRNLGGGSVEVTCGKFVPRLSFGGARHLAAITLFRSGFKAHSSEVL